MSSNFVLIFLCMFLGFLLRKTGRFPDFSHQAFNGFVIWISLPALVLFQVPTLLATFHFDALMLVPMSMAWLLFLTSWALFHLLGKRLKWSSSQTGALVLTAGLGNTAFVGFPLLDSFYGEAGVQIGLLVDQPGTFLVLSTLGLFVAALYSPQVERRFHLRQVLLSVLKFPPFVALLVAIAGFAAGILDPDAPWTPIFESLSLTLVPLALVGVGFQLKFSPQLFKSVWRPLMWGLGFKLFAAPILFWSFYVGYLGNTSLLVKVTIIEAAMAPMITASVVAEECGLDASIAGLMVGLGIPLSLVTVSLWNAALG